MILYNDISISFAYISNEHSMVFASQKGARLGATAPVRCSALQGLLPCDSPRIEACDYTKVQTQPVAIQAGGLDQTIHPQDLEEFSR